jgi:hypothetical protein
VTLHIPDGINELDALAAALAYANAGWYVLPVRTDTKHPGSVVGGGWPALSSRDAAQIAAWFAGTDYGIALHAGRSGAVILDVDDYDNVPDLVLAAIENTGCPYQSTRADQPGRGHYLLANDTGRRIGNGLGRLASPKKWGEVRGANGVIIVAPSVHPDGGLYRWERTGALPGIPDYVAEALPDSTTPESTATDAEIEKFLDTHTEATKPEALAGLVSALTNKLASGHSCHMSTLGVLTDAMGEAAAGFYDARTATRELWPIYAKVITTGTSTGRVLTPHEAAQSYKGIVAWAIGQAEAGAAKARERIEAKFRDNVTEIAPEEIVGPVEVTAPLEAIEEQFWTSRDSLKLIYDAALSKMCAPWAVLACCVARTLTLIPPDVKLPDVIGFGGGTLNWFAAIVAKSGGGKGAANSVAGKLVQGDILIRGAGSGEGMIEAYNRKADPQDHVTAILFSVDEVDSIASMQARAGQTTMSVIRSGFSGENLGYSYRGRASEKVEDHSYRMTMIVSVQPERAGGLFADSSGGTPQRFQWFPGRDKRIQVDRPAWPTDAAGQHRVLPSVDIRTLPYGGMSIPPEAEALIVQVRADSNNGGKDNVLDGHAIYCREKFAYALAIMDGRTTMNSDDWKLSGIAASVSDWCRLRAQSTLAAAEKSMAAERGRIRGIESYEADIARSVMASDDIKRILKWAVGKLRAAEGGRIAKPKLKKLAASRDRVKVVEAMLSGVEAGLIIGDEDDWVLL